MKIRGRIIAALFSKDLKMTLLNKNSMVMAILPVFFAFIYGYIIPIGNSAESQNYLIVMCEIMNLAIVPVSLLSMMVAEEKEKNTLRTLMLSDVSAEEFLFSKSAVALLIMNVVALIDFFLLQGSLSLLPVYLIAGTLASLGLLFLGAAIGLLSKDQMATGTLSAPVMILFMLPSIFSMMNKGIHQFARFLPTTAFIDMYYSVASGAGILAGNSLFALTVMLVWVILCIFIFRLVYLKKGMDQ